MGRPFLDYHDLQLNVRFRQLTRKESQPKIPTIENRNLFKAGVAVLPAMRFTAYAVSSRTHRNPYACFQRFSMFLQVRDANKHVCYT